MPPQTAAEWTIKEQIIHDPVSGLSIQFLNDLNGLPRLRIFGDIPFGNREFLFDITGKEAGSGTGFFDSCCATWIKEITA